MRLRPRPVPQESYNASSDDVVQLRGNELPVKAQSILGARGRVDVSNSNGVGRQEVAHVRRAEQRGFGRLFGAQKSPVGVTSSAAKPNMPSWSRADIPSRGSSDILPNSTTIHGRPPGSSRNGSTTAVQTHQFYPDHQPSIESLRRDYYDATKQPLYVSQQTSASAVRDMGLRKGTPVVQEMPSEPMPLKSAMKHPKPLGSHPNGNDTSKKAKKLDIASLFPQPRPSNGPLLSPNKLVYSPSTMTDAFEYFPQGTLQAELRRQGSRGRFETYKSVRPAAVELIKAPRVKIFEPDIYDNTKTHTRRPPKGIKNWFDSFDISSDEEEQDPVELPANPPRPSVEAIPSDFSPYGVISPAVASARGRNTTRQRDTKTIIDEDLVEVSRSRSESTVSEGSTVTRSSSSVARPTGNVRGGESRLAHSKLESESVLSLSSGSEDERSELSAIRDNRVVVQEAEVMKSQRPSIPPRKLSNTQVSATALRRREGTPQSTRSTPAMPTASSLAPPMPDRVLHSGHSDPTDKAQPRKISGLRDSQSLPARSRKTSQSTHERDDVRSTGGDTFDSVPSDASRVMAVTEEEMMLLDLMRKKRAAMAKNSFSEGYRLALKQEQEHLMRRRDAAHNTVLAALKERDEMEEQINALPRLKERMSATTLQREKEEDSKRYSVFRKQDVDNTFKMGRFLAAESHQEEPFVAKMARMERFLMMKPSLADAIQDRRPLSGTEIEADSLTLTEEEDVELLATEEEDPEFAAPSPIQRLAEMSRESPRTSPPREEEIEEHHEKVRAFLASNRASRDTSAAVFPSPPGNRRPEKQRKRTSLLQSSVLPEDVPQLPEISDRGPNRTPLQQSQVEARQHSTSGPFESRPIPSRQLVDFESELLSTFKLQDSDHAGLSLDPASLEPPSGRTVSPPSVTTSHPSPLTPTFARIAPLDKAMVDIPENDNPAIRDVSYSPEPELAHDVHTPTTVMPRNPKRTSKRAPPRINTKDVKRVTSMSSTSAGEDVLAAWAELGGGRDALAFRRRGF